MNEDAFEVPERTEYRYLVQDEDEDEVQYVHRRRYVSPFLVPSRRCVALVCVCVVSLLALASYLAYVAQTLPPGLAQVATSCGEFRGRHVSQCWEGQRSQCSTFSSALFCKQLPLLLVSCVVGDQLS